MDTNDWTELNGVRRKRWRAAVFETGQLWLPRASTWVVPPALLELIAEYSFDLLKPRFDWRALDVDDLICTVGGLTLRVEQMDPNWWWWRVYSWSGRDPGHHSVRPYDSDDWCHFPTARTWRDAVTFAEMSADHFLRLDDHTRRTGVYPSSADLTYLTHAPKPPVKPRKHGPGRGPRNNYCFPNFPDDVRKAS